MFKEIWFIKRLKDSDVEKVILFFESEILANASHYRAVRDNDARKMFGNEFPKEISSAWQ